MTDRFQSRAETHRPRRYRGGCPCGAVLWEARLDLAHDEQPADTVWQRSVPSPLFRVLRGGDGLSGVQFFANSAHHFFCVRCSAHAFSHRLDNDGPELYTIDLRSLHAERAPALCEREPAAAATVARPPSG